jgi:hypothetical protein
MPLLTCTNAVPLERSAESPDPCVLAGGRSVRRPNAMADFTPRTWINKGASWPYRQNRREKIRDRLNAPLASPPALGSRILCPAT